MEWLAVGGLGVDQVDAVAPVVTALAIPVRLGAYVADTQPLNRCEPVSRSHSGRGPPFLH
jgi:hypothetical protein